MKIGAHVLFPVKIDMTPFLQPTSTSKESTEERPYQNQEYTYKLFGVCNHSGSLSGGHYTAHTQIMSANSEGKENFSQFFL